MFFAFMFFTHFVHAFNLNVTKTDETCTANGALNIAVTNTVSGATIIYTIYCLPDLTTRPSNYSGSLNQEDITQLATGNYSVVVTEPDGCSTLKDIYIDHTTCFIPNVITPNEDGTNESLDLTGFDVARFDLLLHH